MHAARVRQRRRSAGTVGRQLPGEELRLVGPDGADVELSELTSFLSDRGVATFKFPESLVITRELPSNAGGKIDKEAVRRLAAQGRT